MIRGEIYMVDLPKTTTSIQAGFRPCILVSNDKANTYSPTVQIVPLTTQEKKYLPTHVEIDRSCGLLLTSIALCEQITIVSKECFKERVGKCDFNTLKKVEKGMSIQLGMAIA